MFWPVGLVSKVFPADELVNEAIKTAEKISDLSKIAVQIAKEAINTGAVTIMISLWADQEIFLPTAYNY